MVWPLRVDDHDLKPGSLLHSDITLTVYGGSQITHRGTIAITCSYKRESTRVSFYVTEILGPAMGKKPSSSKQLVWNLYSVSQKVLENTKQVNISSFSTYFMISVTDTNLLTHAKNVNMP